MSHRAAIWDHRGKWLWAKADGHCAYCGVQFRSPREMTVDHILPRSRGGNNSQENRLPACETCNKSKGKLPLAQFREALRRKRDGVPYFGPAQLAYLEASGLVLPPGEAFVFYWETLGHAFPEGTE